MATTIETMAAPARPWAADTFEKILSAGAVILGTATAAAIVRGRGHRGEAPLLVRLDLLTIAVAVGLTPTLLLSRRGTPRHRLLGRGRAVAMLATAALSFGIRTGGGGYSIVHLLSGWTLLQMPLIRWSARTRRVVGHLRAVRGMVTGALLVAGFTFPFDRMLGNRLFG